ncbi:hypothetical protein [uncultured Dokdonia sp.]|uniref:hypothetical protein n=1 Tax=uncultured Dokdonia sp. TaxID=575653 RepID=UPI00260F56AE|nr:hypothetical protein [uncultured Dokdonia sp.]
MRIMHRYLNSNSHLNVIGPVMKILDEYSHSYKYKEDLNCVIPSFKYNIEFYLYEDNSDFIVLKKKLNEYLEPQVIGTEYDKEDEKNAEWFLIRTGEYQYPQPEKKFVYRESTFNLENYCKFCDIGKVQNNVYRLKSEPKQKQLQFWGLHWEFGAVFVRDVAKKLIEREGVRGVRFTQPVLHKENVKIKDFYQLHIDTVLDKGFNSYNTDTITCRYNNEEGLNKSKENNYCGRIKYHHPFIGGYCFDKNIFNSNFDIVETYEYFGGGGSAQKLQIVSKRFKNLIEKKKLKGLIFIPVMHEEYNHVLNIKNNVVHAKKSRYSNFRIKKNISLIIKRLLKIVD